MGNIITKIKGLFSSKKVKENPPINNQNLVDPMVVDESLVEQMTQREKEDYARKIINRLVELKKNIENRVEDMSPEGQEVRGWRLKSLYDSLFSLALNNEQAREICNKPDYDEIWRWRLTGFRYKYSVDFRLKPQYKFKIFEQVLATWLEFKCLSGEPLGDESKKTVLQAAQSLGSFYAMNEKLSEDIEGIQKKNLEKVHQVSLTKMLACAEQMAKFHGTVGWLFQALVFYHLLENYDKFSVEQKNELSGFGFKNPIDGLNCVITSFYMAWFLESYSQAAMNNAYFGLNVFKTLHEKISEIIVVKNPPETTSTKDSIDALDEWLESWKGLLIPTDFTMKSFEIFTQLMAKPVIDEIETQRADKNDHSISL